MGDAGADVPRGRAYLGIGSGEALNEVPVGDEWPSPADQIARLEEALLRDEGSGL